MPKQLVLSFVNVNRGKLHGDGDKASSLSPLRRLGVRLSQLVMKSSSILNASQLTRVKVVPFLGMLLPGASFQGLQVLAALIRRGWDLVRMSAQLGWFDRGAFGGQGGMTSNSAVSEKEAWDTAAERLF